MPLLDLSHSVVPGQRVYPGDPTYSVAAHFTIDMPQRCMVSRLEMGSHQGTHLDAMSHFLAEGRTIEQMPLDWFYGPVRVLRLPKPANSEIGVEDFLPYARWLTEEAKIIYETGWHREFGQERFFTEFPSLTQEAARYLASKKLRLLGMDTPTPSRDYYEVHHTLLGAEMVIVESLARLDEVPDEFVFAGFPLPLAGLDGSPIRAVAITA